MQDNGILLDELAVHKRYDGQNLRFLLPKNIATEALGLESAYLVFPRYKKGEVTKIEPISTMQALSNLIKSGYDVNDSYDEATIRQWINLVKGLKKYTITYSDMADACQHLEKLMNI